MVDGVSRALWTPIPADRGQISRMIVDNFKLPRNAGASAARAADRVSVDLEIGISKIGNRSNPPPIVDTPEESAVITTDSAALSTTAWNRWIS